MNRGLNPPSKSSTYSSLTTETRVQMMGGNSLKVIGLLGGMSWESTAEYYRLLNMLAQERLGGLHSTRCVLYSLDFAEIERLQVEEAWDEAAARLGEAAKALQAAGAEMILICSNTMHIVADKVAASVRIPLVHIADITADAVCAAGLTRVGLLGTAFTMERDFYARRLTSRGLQVLLPSLSGRRLVHQVIYNELCRGIVREESREAYRSIIKELVDRGAAGIVLGCTEIELLVKASDCPVPIFPTTRLHAEAAIARAFNSNES